ncbi:hypothetical protein [Nocardia sp. X0981]
MKSRSPSLIGVHRRVTDRGSPEELFFVAFHGDCEHEVPPVTDGFRITLTYNLVAKGRTGPADDPRRRPSTRFAAACARGRGRVPSVRARRRPGPGRVGG